MPQPADAIREIAEALFPYDCGVTTPDNEQLFRVISDLVPARVLRFPSGCEFNGWTVPDSWAVRKAEILRDGQVIFDGTAHPLGVAALSKSFSGVLSHAALAAHIHTRPDKPAAYGYHCMWQYRPWERDWCLCVPDEQFARWPTDGEYRVDLVTESTPGHMLVADCVLPGEIPETIVINAHTCHPRQANDDIVGAAVAIHLFQALARQPRRYTYRLVLGPEHLGTVFFLQQLAAADRERMIGGYFLEMPGTPFPLKVASSFLGDQAVDRALRHAVKHAHSDFTFVPWRQGAGNDETVWEAPGYEIPFVEFSRCRDTFDPFPEYHTSEDTLDRIDWDNVSVFSDCVAAAIDALERDCVMRRAFSGLPCLSNPRYGLYQERPDPAVSKQFAADAEKWGYLGDCLLRYFDGQTTALDIAIKHDLPFAALRDRIQRFANAELIALTSTHHRRKNTIPA
jgi:aminopeptidase-like protein